MSILLPQPLRTIYSVLTVVVLLAGTALAQTEQKVATEQKAPPVVTIGEEGFMFKSATGDFKLQIRGYIQFDGRFFFSEVPPGTDTFAVRRARPILEGTLFKNFDFKIMPDFGLGTTVLQEAYMDVNFTPVFRVRAGKFKSPVGLERLQSAVDLFFVERGLPTNLVPNRDLGIVVFGDLAGGRLNYTGGILNGSVDGASNDLNSDNQFDGAVRLFTTPFKQKKYNLGVGIAATYGDHTGTPASPGLPRYATEGLQAFFTYRSDGTVVGTSIADGTLYRYTPQGYFYYGPFGVLSEYVFSSQVVRRDLATATIGNSAWQVVGGYFLTGENATYKHTKTKANFNPSKGTWGAWEVKARYAHQAIDDDAFPIFADPTKSAEQTKTFGVGVNWLLNNNFEFMVDYNRSNFKGGSPSGDRPDEDLIWMRLQIAF